MKYPIYFCRVKGRILTPKKPTKKTRFPKPKVQHFNELIPVKFYPDSDTPTQTRSISLAQKFSIAKNAKVEYDYIIRCIEEQTKYSNYEH